MIGDAKGQIWWDTGSYQGVHYHRIRPGNEVLYQEIRDQAAWGTVFLGTSESQGVRLPARHSRYGFLTNISGR